MRFMALVYIEPGAMEGMSADDFQRLDDATIEGMALVGWTGQRGGRGDLGRRPGAMAR